MKARTNTKRSVDFPTNFVGLNWDATVAGEEGIEPVTSVIGCDSCKYELDPHPYVINGTTFGCINRVFCPFNEVKIDGKFYHRSRIHFSGGDELEEEEALEEKRRCHDCGVQSGFIHHINCDCEECPKCGGQLISCECGFNKDGNKDLTFRAVPDVEKIKN